MKKALTKKAFPLQDGIVTAVCLLGALLSLILFAIDLNRTMTRISEQPVGIITFKYKAAQRRFVDRVIWDRLRRQSPVYNGDFIRTADLSEATVTFGGGEIIDLSENCLIQIHVDSDGGARIDIAGGGVQASSSEGGRLILNSNGKSVNVSGVVSAHAGQSGGFTIRVVEGNAVLSGDSSGDQSTTENVEAGTVYAFGGNNAAPQLAVLSPKPTAKYINPGTGNFNIPFQWNKINFSGEVKLELAGDRKFSRMIREESAGGNGITLDLPEGSYFWRAFPAAGGVQEAPASGKLTIVNAPAPVRLGPADNAVYRYRTKQPAIPFQWTEAPGASSYLLEVSDNPEFTNPAISSTVQGTSLSTKDLGAGTWYWRVSPRYSADYEGVPAAGQPAVLRIERGDALAAPVLQNPPEAGMVNIGQNRGDFYFSWRGNAEAASYTIRISSNRNLSNPVVEQTVKDSFFSYKRNASQLKEGQYYWGVVLTDTEGSPSPLSQVRSFTALAGEVTQRTIFPPDNYIIQGAKLPDIRFTWKSNLPYETKFQIAGDPEFSRMVLNETARGDAYQGRMLPEGTYYWRIASEGADRQFQTAPKRFTAAPPLPAPVLAEPPSQGRVVFMEGEEIPFRWGTVAGADYYQFKLYRNENRQEPVLERNLSRINTLNISAVTYGEGSYFWTVQAFANETSLSTRRTGIAAEETFSARRLRPVSLEYPQNGYTVEGLRAYLEPGTVRWSQTDPASSSLFILSRNRNLSSPVVQLRNPGTTISLPQLQAGTYYWTIRAETAEGYDLSARESRTFQVLPIPRLSPATNMLPEEGQIIGPAELRATRSINFSWDPVPQAEGYFITVVYQGEGGTREIIRSGLLEETSYVLDDLTLLDVGNFIWRVEAVSSVRKRDEEILEILQRGEVKEGRFSVQFETPVSPEIKKPGVMYGR